MPELIPRRARSDAFALDRPDTDQHEPSKPALGELLAPVQPGPKPGETSQVTPRPRGAGGRPPGTQDPRRIVSTAARVPVEVYAAAEDLVKGRGKPSWGQLIASTCQTQPTKVTEQVLQQLQPPADGVFIPRGQNRAGTSSTQVTARFVPAEKEAFDQAVRAAQNAATQDGHEAPVTATAVVVAALKVALRAQPGQ